MKPLIYLIEDDHDISRVIIRAMEQQGMEIAAFRRISDFKRALARQVPDLCLIDLTLPDGDGLNLVDSSTLPATVPRIVVTGRGDLTDRIVGLELGADDYVVKPFEPRELASRVKAVLRRSQNSSDMTTQPSTLLRFGDWVADLEACTITHQDGRIYELSAAEAALLGVFLASPGRVLSRGQLLDQLTGRAEEPADRSMDARVSRLRKKLRDDPASPKIIRTVYGAGYVFCMTPTHVSN